MFSKATNVTFKARRMLQIKKLENEYLKLSRRYDQITDPVYIGDIKHRLHSMENNKKERLFRSQQLEIEQQQLDKRILKNQRDQSTKYLTADGQYVDKFSQMQQELMVGIDVLEKKIEKQNESLQASQQRKNELQHYLEEEQEKQKKLKQIAEGKYNMTLSRLNDYLPKSKEHFQKIEALERKMIKEAKREKGELRRAMTATQ